MRRAAESACAFESDPEGTDPRSDHVHSNPDLNHYRGAASAEGKRRPLF